ncbi:MAG: creatininase [Rhodobacteraceae bacterium]|nr:creatininase [Paracoccaceae bacterium]MBR28116.1 creatininase [Paracoccaceae bacterium]
MDVEWARLKAQDLRRLAAQDAIVVLPVASIEQHGPHLPVMTDTRLGAEVAHRAARIVQAARPIVVAPVVWAGLSEHHMPFGGTLTVSPATFRAVLSDLVTAILRHGFRKILISNSHGGNMLEMQAAVDELAPRFPDAAFVATTYPAEAAAGLAALLDDQPGIQHACEGETSMMMAVEPDLVDASDLAALASEPGPKFLAAGAASYRWRPFAHATANGVAGNPARASADKGEAMLDVAAQAIAALILDPETWAPPRDLRGEGAGGVPFRR